jgi:DNA (cytosine-5)-methyltransferase 1
MHPRYISLFSGIGGLEPSSGAPVVFCELDASSREVLSRSHPNARIHDDVRTLKGESAEFVLGGWPCQDLSIAGRMVGLNGEKSGLFYELCRVIEESGAHTAIMENVPGLAISNSGKDFGNVISALNSKGLCHIAWRTINSVELGLPHFRERIFIVASRSRQLALALHAKETEVDAPKYDNQRPQVLGFYWTAGARSLCFRKNAVPTLKVGAPSEKGGTSPVAVFYGKTVRKLTPIEAIRLQGFDPKWVEGLAYGDVLRMAGDAVSRPVGAFVVDSVFKAAIDDALEIRPAFIDSIPEHGYWHGGKMCLVKHRRVLNRYRHILDFLDPNANNELSPQASAGLCCRIIRAGADVPSDLFETLYNKSKTRTKLLGTKVDSFEILHDQLDPLAYLLKLKMQQQNFQMDLIS